MYIHMCPLLVIYLANRKDIAVVLLSWRFGEYLINVLPIRSLLFYSRYGQCTWWTQTGLDQYAIKKFGEALEVIPRILSETSGQDAEKVGLNLRHAAVSWNGLR